MRGILYYSIRRARIRFHEKINRLCSCNLKRMERMAVMGFAEKLKEKRTAAGLTQKELAERCGVTARTIQNYELRIRRPLNFSTVQNIARNLHTSTEYLLSDSYASGSNENPDGTLVQLTEELTELFLSQELCEAQLDAAMQALWRAYWIARGVR